MILRFLEHALFIFKTVSIYSAILILQFKQVFFILTHLIVDSEYQNICYIYFNYH